MSNFEPFGVHTQGELTDALDSHRRVVVVWTAPGWCGPCKRLEPHIKKAAASSPLAFFVVVDIDQADQEFVSDHNILSVPTLQLFEDGKYVRDLKQRTVLSLLSEIG